MIHWGLFVGSRIWTAQPHLALKVNCYMQIFGTSPFAPADFWAYSTMCTRCFETQSSPGCTCTRRSNFLTHSLFIELKSRLTKLLLLLLSLLEDKRNSISSWYYQLGSNSMYQVNTYTRLGFNFGKQN